MEWTVEKTGLIWMKVENHFGMKVDFGLGQLISIVIKPPC